MPGFRALGILFFCGLFIKLIADNVMPGLLIQIAEVGGTLSTGTRSTFQSF